MASEVTLAQVRDRVGDTPITGATMPTGGIGLFGWLSAIWKLISDRLVTLTLVGNALKVDNSAVTQPISASSLPLPTNAASQADITNSVGINSDVTATTDTGTFSLIALFKRFLSVTLAKGQAVMASSLPVVIASNQSAVPVTVQDGLVVSGSLSGVGAIFTQDTTGYQSVFVQVTNAGTACTITYETSVDGTTYDPVIGYQLSTGSSYSPTATTTTATFRIFPCYGKFFRARVSVFGSGTVSVSAVFRTSPYIGSSIVTLII
ncbi:hypothetical protein FD724_06645 [Nostoc sp. C057]|uniref:hypothetical protein n=1 Tax=Nostoc sp. C057 TaxID=2576903 RepID=UPI0015C3329C|nr:hypothetical protein [Nostoc sp. C057]QLE47818.1 hypothetical protein FD724_06645 [Nostoc sp. C057]